MFLKLSALMNDTNLAYTAAAAAALNNPSPASIMALYAGPETIGHVAKRPRVDFHHTSAAAAAAAAAVAQTTAHFNSVSGFMSQQYIEQQLAKRSNEPEKPNHILLFTVLNPTYPITCEVLHTICSPLGNILRIVIFKKNGVQAMVEFETIDIAKNAKENLHGCDIYSGCCTLKIEYAKPTKLNVYKNDTDSYDYTNPNLGKKPVVEPPQPPVSQRPVLLKEPPAMTAAMPTAGRPANCATTNALANNGNILNGSTLGMSRSPTGSYENGFGHSPPQISTNGSPGGTLQTGIDAATFGGAQAAMAGQTAGFNRAAVAAAAGQVNGALIRGGGGNILATAPITVPSTVANSQGTTAGNPGGYQHQGSVCMVYGLNAEKMNATHIFNLFCLYGNVVRVKFLKTKEGCAMVQMGDALAVERVVSNLNNSTFFGNKMQLGFSKQAFLADVQSPYKLPDGTPSFQDFMGSKNNRFINPEMASKNRIQPPSKILHFFNTPPGLESNDIEEIFNENGSPTPKCIKMFPSKTERSSSGLIEFETLSDALEGLVASNHHPVPNPNGKFPYIMKLCFSSSRSIPTTIR